MPKSIASLRGSVQGSLRRRLARAITIVTVLLVALLLAGSATAETPLEANARRLAACNTACGRIRDDANAANCAKGGTNCWDDVYGCMANICFFGYDPVYVAAPAYLGCIDAAYATYHARLRDINAVYLAAGKTFDAKDARHVQGKAADAKLTDDILACKAAACDPMCRAAGNESGLWTPRAQNMWERCDCIPKPQLDVPPEKIPNIRSGELASQGVNVPVGSVPCKSPVTKFRVRLHYTYGFGSVAGTTTVCYFVQEVDQHDMPGRKTRICFTGYGLTLGIPTNFGVPGSSEWMLLESRRGALCLEDLQEAKGYHLSAGAYVYGGAAFVIGTRVSLFQKQLEMRGVGSQLGGFEGIDWMFGTWRIVDRITESYRVKSERCGSTDIKEEYAHEGRSGTGQPA